MVKWCNKLYMDDTIRKNPDKWKSRLEESKLSGSLFCIALASNEKNLFDVMDCNELWFRHYRQNSVYVVGLAEDKGSAFGLLQEIIGDIYKETGGFDVRSYFKFDEG